MFRNILVCVDGSVHAELALDQAIDLCDSSHGRLTILTAIPRPSYWAISPATAAGMEPLAADLARQARAALDRAVASIPASIPVTTILTEKPIREAIKARLSTGEHDLLVLGSRGRGALAASLLGSVSHYALNHSPVAMLVVHAAEGPELAGSDQPPEQPVERRHGVLA